MQAAPSGGVNNSESDKFVFTLPFSWLNGKLLLGSLVFRHSGY